MKKLALLLLILIPLIGKSQSAKVRLAVVVGSPVEKILSLYEANKVSHDYLVTENGKLIGIEVHNYDLDGKKSYRETLIISSDSICMWQVIEPLSSEFLSRWIEYFNKNTVNISSSEWRLYRNRDVVQITILPGNSSDSPRFIFRPFTSNDSNRSANSPDVISSTKPAASSVDAVEYSKKCTDIVLEILKSSDEYIKITKGLNQLIKDNGGLYFHLELWASPNPKEDDTSYSTEYKFDLHEVYSDRSPRIASFVFDPNKKLLYKEDRANMKLIPISFNRDLLIKLNNTVIGK